MLLISHNVQDRSPTGNYPVQNVHSNEYEKPGTLSLVCEDQV